MHLKKVLFSVSLMTFLLTINVSLAQQQFTLYHMPVLSQSTYLNAASVPEHKVSLTLPGTSVFFGFNNSAFNVKSLLDKQGNLHYAKFVEGLKESNNYVGAGATVDLFHLRFKAANNFFSVSSRFINDTRFLFPKDLLGVGSTGFQDQYNLSGLGIHSSTYIENAVGFTRVKPDSKWTYGGRVKLLHGIANVQTDRSDFKLNVNQEGTYNYDLALDAEVNTSIGLNENVIDDLDELSNLTSLADYQNAIQLNQGFAIDGGVTYQYSDRLSFGLAANDIGFINWKSYARNYRAQLNTSFDGVVFEDFQNLDIDTDSLVNHFEEQLNQGTDTTKNAYRTWLPANLFLSAHYQLSPKVKASASLYSEFFRGVALGATAGLNVSLGRGLDLTTSWWYSRRSAANMGIGLVFKPKWIQFHLILDNVLPASLVEINDSDLGVEKLVLPYHAKNFNVRFGINLVFGTIKNESMLPAQGLKKRKNAFRKYLYKPSSN